MTVTPRSLLDQQRKLQREHHDSTKAYVHKAIGDFIAASAEIDEDAEEKAAIAEYKKTGKKPAPKIETTDDSD